MSLENEIKKLIEAKESIDESVVKMEKSFAQQKTFFYWIIGILGSAIIYSVITTTRVDTRLNGAEKDIEYVRINAANKKTLDKINQGINNYNESVEKLITDPENKEAIKYFNDGMKKILDEIISWNSEIEPRGRVESRQKKTNLTLN